MIFLAREKHVVLKKTTMVFNSYLKKKHGTGKATMLISLNLTFTLCLPGKHVLFHGQV